jgi:hypothetical protein
MPVFESFLNLLKDSRYALHLMFSFLLAIIFFGMFPTVVDLSVAKLGLPADERLWVLVPITILFFLITLLVIRGGRYLLNVYGEYKKEKENKNRIMKCLPKLSKKQRDILKVLFKGANKYHPDRDEIKSLSHLKFIHFTSRLSSTQVLFEIDPTVMKLLAPDIARERKIFLAGLESSLKDNEISFLKSYFFEKAPAGTKESGEVMARGTYYVCLSLMGNELLSDGDEYDLVDQVHVIYMSQDAVPFLEELLKKKIVNNPLYLDMNFIEKPSGSGALGNTSSMYYRK